MGDSESGVPPDNETETNKTSFKLVCHSTLMDLPEREKGTGTNSQDEMPNVPNGRIVTVFHAGEESSPDRLV